MKVKYTLYYLDDDIIPECILEGGSREYIMSYQNGQVVSVGYAVSILAKEGTSDIRASFDGTGVIKSLTFYELKNGEFSVKGNAKKYWGMEDDEGKETYYVEGEKTSEKKYNKYIDSLGEYNISFLDGRDYIYMAYKKLTNPEE